MKRRAALALLPGLALAPAAIAKTSAGRKLKVDGGVISVVIGDDAPVPRATIMRWVERASAMVIDYFGRFPVPTLRVEIVTGGAGALGWGQHFRGKVLEIHAGRKTTKADVARDWVMVHEMMHCAFPWLLRKHRWCREGLSTYLEDVVRAEAGVITEQDVWRRWTELMPNGVPRGEGFDKDRSWGATYWGGALFWLVVDLGIRERTNGERTLKDGLRVILNELGSSRTERKIEKVMATGDRATKTTVFTEQYKAFGREGKSLDLASMFERLGVSEGPVFNNNAPKAALRQSLTRAHYALPRMR